MAEEDKGLEYRRWGVSPSRAAFLLVHGFGAHAGRWEAMWDFFAQRSIASYAVELKNFNSQSGRSDFFRDHYAKILRLRRVIANEHPGRPIFLIGESFGAIISLLLAPGESGLFSGIICISPAFASRARLTAMEGLKIAVSILYDPNKQFKLPFDSSMCTRDTDYVKKMDEDLQEYRTISSRLVLDILLAQAKARSIKTKIKLPALFLLAGEDKLVDSALSKNIFYGMTVKDKTLLEFPGMYHSLTIELGKEKVFEEILKWVEERMKE